MKIATYNVNSIRRRLPIVLDWLAQHQPDVLCLQETKVQDLAFPLLELRAAGYHVTFRGRKAYNGVATLTRREPEFVLHGDRKSGVEGKSGGPGRGRKRGTRKRRSGGRRMGGEGR